MSLTLRENPSTSTSTWVGTMLLDLQRPLSSTPECRSLSQQNFFKVPLLRERMPRDLSIPTTENLLILPLTTKEPTYHSLETKTSSKKKMKMNSDHLNSKLHTQTHFSQKGKPLQTFIKKIIGLKQRKILKMYAGVSDKRLGATQKCPHGQLKYRWGIFQ